MSRCDSAAMVENTSELLPEPETPVKTVRRRLGSSTLTSLRLFSRAPWTRIRSWLSAAWGTAAGVTGLLGMVIVSPCQLASSHVTRPWAGHQPSRWRSPGPHRLDPAVPAAAPSGGRRSAGGDGRDRWHGATLVEGYDTGFSIPDRSPGGPTDVQLMPSVGPPRAGRYGAPGSSPRRAARALARAWAHAPSMIGTAVSPIRSTAKVMSVFPR